MVRSSNIGPSGNARGKAKSPNNRPETADDFLDIGVTLEEAGEKWQAGDVAKASRFFVRALQNYDDGLQVYPSSFDLLYNRARLQYYITQRPSLLARNSSELSTLLYEAVQSHKRALLVDPENSDVMFNTGQVLSSLADVLSHDEAKARALLEEAVALFSECLSRQEERFEHDKRLGVPKAIDPSEPEDDGPLRPVPVSLSPPDGGSVDREDVHEVQWASLVEPVTPSTLVETCTALLEALAALCSVVSTSSTMNMINMESESQKISRKLSDFAAEVQNDQTRDEARAEHVTMEVYSQQLKTMMDAMGAEMTPTSAFLCCCADAYIAFVAATAGWPDSATLRWRKLGKALELLQEAIPLANGQTLASIHLERGDIELTRLTICLEGGLPEALSDSGVRFTLLKNAETYYKGAAAIAQKFNGSQIFAVATVKQAVAISLKTESNEAVARLDRDMLVDSGTTRRILQELVDESVVSEALLRGCGIA